MLTGIRRSALLSRIAAFTRMNHVAASLQKELAPSDDDNAIMDWDNLGFSYMATDYMYKTICDADGNFSVGRMQHYSDIRLTPAAGILNYGQGLFEGTKAYRKDNKNLLLFRPDENWRRMRDGAERLCMHCPSMDRFIDAVKQTALANKRWVPPPGKGALYIRPLLMGSGPVLGLAPAPEVTFLVYASPVGNYFKTGGPLNLLVEEEYHRAFPGGVGGVKTVANYSPVLKAMRRAKENGFSDVLYLDCVERKYIEEVSSCNIFVVKGREIITPERNGRILGGVTRKSVIEIAEEKGYKVEERKVSVKEVMEADEVFCSGTAVGVVGVGSVTYRGERAQFRTGDGCVVEDLRRVLVGIQRGDVEDDKGWTILI